MAITTRFARWRLWLILGLALGVAAGYLAVTQPIRAGLDQPSTIPVAWLPPPGVVQISPCVPHMGQHWANPETLPLGPIYNVHNGRLIAIEYAVAYQDFADAKDWTDLTLRYWDQPLTIVHADIEFQRRGHPGYEVPHYDLHFYLVTHAEDHEITCQ